MLAKTLHILKRNDEAIVHLENLVTLQETCVDDEQAKKDGIDLLNKLKR
ncbi:hypothetical protein A3Q56_08795 [Intoshia linei]|uniref:Uncharacterized protein n=1 Tax=Intoshia linei TaxID=1819745 RepID=A0A177AN75_9BILA|nr:hypothetical protein A3Q56_08795 [Intoshia linei]